tara:strand:+ start:633 stop:947 length:315 start_codon:yes stop_codon:yes gene_type:complete
MKKRTIVCFFLCGLGLYFPWYTTIDLSTSPSLRILLVSSCFLLALATNYRQDKNTTLMGWLLLFSLILHISSTLIINRETLNSIGLGSFFTLFNSLLLIFPAKK